MISTLKSLSKNIRGVTAVEFAMILPLMLFMLFGVFQLGYIAYVQHRMETAVREAARLGITGNPGAFASRDALVTDYITKVMNTFPHLDTPSPSVVIQAAPTFSAYASAPPLEPLVLDSNGNGVCDPGDQYIDYDGPGDPGYHTRNAIASKPGAGKPNQVIRYTATFSLRTFMPFVADIFGTDGHLIIQARTIARNEAYALTAPYEVVTC